jgi:predicted DNA-binding transcriptional regulator AlpA
VSDDESSNGYEPDEEPEGEREDVFEFERWAAERFAANEWANTRARVDLVGTAEVAEILGVERPRIGRWIGKGQMPMPVMILRATPVWRRRDIEAMRDAVDSRKKRAAA